MTNTSWVPLSRICPTSVAVSSPPAAMPPCSSKRSSQYEPAEPSMFFYCLRGPADELRPAREEPGDDTRHVGCRRAGPALLRIRQRLLDPASGEPGAVAHQPGRGGADPLPRSDDVGLRATVEGRALRRRPRHPEDVRGLAVRGADSDAGGGVAGLGDRREDAHGLLGRLGREGLAVVAGRDDDDDTGRAELVDPLAQR